MKRFIFALPLILAAGCRTYVGSDDVFETTPPKTIKSEAGVGLRRGVVLEVKNGKYILTFAERSDLLSYEKTEKYYCGRKYYYLDRSNGNLYLDTYDLNIVLAVIISPISTLAQWYYDGERAWEDDWKRRGEYAPGIGYCIAYLPVIHCLFTPFLRPPYAYSVPRYLVDYDTQSTKLVMETTFRRFTPVFAPDSTCGEVKISLGGRTISRRLSTSGMLTFDIKDFTDASFNGKPVDFTVVHGNWGQRWYVRSTPFAKPSTLRDWNIFSDTRYDYPTRLKALIRLEQMLGQKCCCEYMFALLNGKQDFTPVLNAEVRISGNPAEPERPLPKTEMKSPLSGSANQENLKRKAKTVDSGMGKSSFALGYRPLNNFLDAKSIKKEVAEAKWEFQSGMFYYYGKGLYGQRHKKDYSEAAKLVRRAAKLFRREAENGDAVAQVGLGVYYCTGVGVSKDYVEAAKWFRKAAGQGNAEAQFKMGLCYYKGLGEEKDHVKAKAWFHKAAEQGYPDARKALRKLHFQPDRKNPNAEPINNPER